MDQNIATVLLILLFVLSFVFLILNITGIISATIWLILSFVLVFMGFSLIFAAVQRPSY